MVHSKQRAAPQIGSHLVNRFTHMSVHCTDSCARACVRGRSLTTLERLAPATRVKTGMTFRRVARALSRDNRTCRWLFLAWAAIPRAPRVRVYRCGKPARRVFAAGRDVRVQKVESMREGERERGRMLGR